MATVSETGWPYVQHRGGRRGFLKIVDEKTLAFADYRGNRQYITVGNLAANDRAALILVDYPGRTRLKIYAHVETVSLDADPVLARLVAEPGYRAKPERILRLRLAAFDWNCPQHITPRFTEAEIAEAMQPLRERLTALEAENAELRARFAATEGAK
jgi:predicted pyridoxine 5'-phosphate oxidase superfamily flavin-nucleotide-binding protein